MPTRPAAPLRLGIVHLFDPPLETCRASLEGLVRVDRRAACLGLVRGRGGDVAAPYTGRRTGSLTIAVR